MSTGVKAAAVAAFVRVFLSALEPMIADWAPVLWLVAAATMILGTVVGVAQTSLNGVTGHPSRATGAQGKSLFEKMTTALVEKITLAIAEEPPLAAEYWQDLPPMRYD